MAAVLQPGGKTKQFRTNEKDTIRYMPEVRDTFYFLCFGSLEFSLCSNLGRVYIYWKKALSVVFFKWWRQLNLVISSRTLERWINLMFVFFFLIAYVRLFFPYWELEGKLVLKITIILLQINRCWEFSLHQVLF